MNTTIEAISLYEASSAISAMKQALEALESLFNGQTDQNRAERCSNAITALRTAIVEAESRATEQAEKSNIKQVIHLYDEPPAAPVQEPLTDEQIKRAKPVCADFVSFRAGVRCVEAMLREKGQTAQRQSNAYDDYRETMRQAFEQQSAPVHGLEKGCHRSHPHENMDAMCELRTEIARLTNENARLKAQPTPNVASPRVQEPVAWVPISEWRWNNDQGCWEGNPISPPAAQPAPNVASPLVQEPIGKLCVLSDGMSERGWSYDISTDYEGHSRLRDLDGALLYTQSPPNVAAPLAAPNVASPRVQEPVAWKNAAIRLGEELSSIGPDGYYDMTAEQWLDWAIDQQPRGKNSLPAAQRQWVGLTQQDIDIAFDDTQEGGGFVKFARAIEAAHGITEQKGGE